MAPQEPVTGPATISPPPDPTTTSTSTTPSDLTLGQSSASDSESQAATVSILPSTTSTGTTGDGEKSTLIATAGSTSPATTNKSSSSTGTAASQTSSPNSSSSAVASGNSGGSKSSTGLSTGAIAGIAVAAVVLVVAIAGFFLWKFCAAKRRNRQRTAAYGQARVGTPAHSNPNQVEKGAPLVGAVAPVYRDSPSPESQNLLPQQADDATVQSRFSTLYDQIELHAENFYKDASPMIPPSVEGSLSRYDTPILGAPLAARLEESPRTTTILKHVLSYEITTTVVDPTSADRRRSLLPTPLLALLQEVQSQQPSQQPGRRGHQTSAYSRLKQLAASYRTSPQSMPATTTSATREAASHFTQVFSLWADPQYDEARRTQHLTEVLDSAIKFSVWLLSQPETFELRWDGSSSGATNASNSSTNDKETSSLGDHSLVTVPALVKVTSNGGNQRLSRNSEKVLCKLVKRPI